MGFQEQRPTGARMSHPDADDPQVTSNQRSRNQEADQGMLFLFSSLNEGEFIAVLSLPGLGKPEKSR